MKNQPPSDRHQLYLTSATDLRYVGYEILNTHLNLKGKYASDYLDYIFNDAFRHYDTDGIKEIEFDRIGGFFTYLT